MMPEKRSAFRRIPQDDDHSFRKPAGSQGFGSRFTHVPKSRGHHGGFSGGLISGEGDRRISRDQVKRFAIGARDHGLLFVWLLKQKGFALLLAMRTSAKILKEGRQDLI